MLSMRSGLVLGVLALAAVSGTAQAQEACTTYTVAEGDSLSSIALAAYGNYNYQIIFNANRDALAQVPAELPAGMQLVLPCPDGRLTEDAALESVVAAETAKQEAAPASNVYEPPLKFVTGNGWAPFTGEDLYNGGILVNLATTSLQRGGNDRDYTMAYVDDWQSHMDVLLPSGAFDVSIAWERPDCTRTDVLSEEMVTRCQKLDFSLPVYEVAYAFFAKPDNKYANINDFKAFEGARICRPDAWGTQDLDEEGLKDPFVQMQRPVNPTDCAEAVLNGTADVFAIEIETATEAFGALNAAQDVVQNPYLSKIISYHFVTAKSNPRGRIYIAMLDRGLSAMRDSGEWYDIVASGLAKYNEAKLAGQ